MRHTIAIGGTVLVSVLVGVIFITLRQNGELADRLHESENQLELHRSELNAAFAQTTSNPKDEDLELVRLREQSLEVHKLRGQITELLHRQIAYDELSSEVADFKAQLETTVAENIELQDKVRFLTSAIRSSQTQVGRNNGPLWQSGSAILEIDLNHPENK